MDLSPKLRVTFKNYKNIDKTNILVAIFHLNKKTSKKIKHIFPLTFIWYLIFMTNYL